MGVVNVTTDSFSDGGHHPDADSAIRHALRLAGQGAAVIDVGGESTRPGAGRIDEATEMARVLPVVEALVDKGLTVSVDTMRASTAEAAIRLGASIINDVSGGRADEDMLGVVASAGVDFVLMHWRAHSSTMQEETDYVEVVGDVRAELLGQSALARNAGIDPDRIILDPGLGFSKTWEQNWELLAAIDRFTTLGHRVLVGASRKRFLGELLGGREPLGRDAATAAVSTWCAMNGVWAVRTHEVADQTDAVRVGERLATAMAHGPGWGRVQEGEQGRR